MGSQVGPEPYSEIPEADSMLDDGGGFAGLAAAIGVP
jgi:hypothetical protein